jgi:hypothetical protein
VSEPPSPPPRSEPSPGPASEPAPLPPPRPTTKRGKPKVPKVKRRGISTYVFGAVIIVIVLAGAYQLYDSLTKGSDPKVGEHWHAALGIDICGVFAENAPTFENQAGTETRAGLHSHGDGLIHIHPFTEDEAGDNATVGRFFEYGGFEVDEEHLKLWDGLDVTNGATCPDGRAAKVRWAVNGEEQSGNPSDFHPEDQDVITIAFLPDGDAIPEPPAEVLAVLPKPADVQEGG